MKLKKAEKLKIVLKAYELFKEDVKYCIQKDTRLDGICEHLYKALVFYKLNDTLVSYTNIAHYLFPEFYNMKPENIDKENYWWSTLVKNGVSPRRKAFKQLIKLYSPKPRAAK